MNVSELIEKLGEYPSEMRVVTRGYESGWHDITIFNEVKLLLNHNKEWWSGEHKEIGFGDDGECDEMALSIDGDNPL